MGYLGKEILEIDDFIYEEVEVPEWGGIVRLKGLSAAERDAYELSIVKPGTNGKVDVNAENLRARLVALSWVDEDGKRVISDREVKKLGSKSGAVLDRLYEICQRLSGLETKAVEKALENLAITPSN